MERRGVREPRSSYRAQSPPPIPEAHHRGLGFNDFIKGKGHGLVVNLLVGKTFSAEAMSEHVRKPLYLIGGGDLGTKASDLDAALERIFDIATAWKAIVLTDEVGLSIFFFVVVCHVDHLFRLG